MDFLATKARDRSIIDLTPAVIGDCKQGRASARIWRNAVEDIKAKIAKLLADAIDCDLIASLATSDDKRDAFRLLAQQHRSMAAALKQTMSDRTD